VIVTLVGLMILNVIYYRLSKTWELIRNIVELVATVGDLLISTGKNKKRVGARILGLAIAIIYCTQQDS
jgi:hypothetical protein